MKFTLEPHSFTSYVLEIRHNNQLITKIYGSQEEFEQLFKELTTHLERRTT